MTWESAQNYKPTPLTTNTRPAAKPVPPPQPKKVVKTVAAVTLPPIIASGERVKTAWGARSNGWVRGAWRDEAGDRSWKRHRRLQRGSLRCR